MDNKTLVSTAARELFEKKDVAAVDRYFADPYIEHNPNVPDGTAALKGLAQGLAQNPAFKYELVRVIADGDLVVLHSRATGFMPQPMVMFDIFRVAGGKIVEHWDVLQSAVEHTASGRTQLDGPTVVTDHHKTEANRKLVQGFLDTILYGGHYDKITDYISTVQYDQHNPGVGDGLAGFNKAMEAMAKAGLSMVYKKTYRLLADGNFVFTHSEGEFAGKHVAFADLFRLENGRIVEHWDCIQDVPAESKNTNGMF